MSTVTSAAGRPCPRCAVPLFAGEVGPLAALGCGACGGLWLDNESTTAVLRHYNVHAARLAELVDENAARVEERSPFAAASGPCPICAKPLDRVEHSGVHLDFCAEHGTFFDRGELLSVLHKNRRPIPVAPRGPSIEQIRTEIRHEAEWQKDPLGTALSDWLTGGKDWVNRWRK